jgi:hypothetical protein
LITLTAILPLFGREKDRLVELQSDVHAAGLYRDHVAHPAALEVVFVP